MDRRAFLVGTAILAGLPGLSLAAPATDRRLVLILLRGGLDGLGAVPAAGDPGYAALRAPVEGALPLDGTFSLNPSLAGLAPLWERKELLVVHATAPPYRDRSHFDAQNVLENGTTTPFGASTGWLNRALGALGQGPLAMAVGARVPLVLRGVAPASCVDPEHLPRLDPGFLAGLASMYGDEPLFAEALQRGVQSAALFQGRSRRSRTAGAELLGAVMSGDDGPRVAVLELGGFDTHTAQDRNLAQRLPEVAAAVDGLRLGLGDVWSRTAVLVATEFGRAARLNGTDGTDHGIGGVALLAGGGVAGGRVVTDWPGLGTKDLVNDRDLRPTTDLRAVFKGVLADLLQVPRAALDREVFPDSGKVAPLPGLFQA